MIRHDSHQRTRRAIASAALVLAAWVPVAAPAASATLTGSSFDVIYDTDGVGLFGTPVLTGSTISFTPAGFLAQSLDGAGPVTLDKTVSLQLVMHGGRSVRSVSLLEQGTYRLAGRQSDVYVRGELRAFGLANPAAQVVDTVTPNIFFPVTGGSLQDWQATASVNLDGAGLDQAGGLGIALQNVLDATSRATDTSAFRLAVIEKSSVAHGITLNVSMVPEPGAWAMLLAGLGALAATRRRNRTALSHPN